MAYFKDFLLNIFIIFSPLALYPYIHKLKHKVALYQTLKCMLFIIVLLATMSVPININGLTYDFRSIPVIIGSLYGGPVVSVILFSILVIYRWFLGNPNNLLYIVSVLPSFFLIFFTLKRYKLLKTSHKILVAILLCTLMKIMTISLYLFLTKSIHLLADGVLDTLETYIIQGVVIALSVYIVEILIKYHYMQDEILRSERIKMVSEMAASVAHEIRNPLTAVKGFIQLLGAEHVKSNEKEFYQKICLDELSRADLIISDYLSLAKTDNESIQDLDVADEIKYLENVLITFANYNNVQIHTQIEHKNCSIIGDKYKFRQALMNVGKNAIEAMHNGGILIMKVSELNGKVNVSIGDTGVGMTPEQISRLGTPYYSTKEKGTGLGMMVTFTIIKKMNGKIKINSEIGKGTEYLFSFPMSKNI